MTTALPRSFTVRAAMMGDLKSVLALYNVCSIEQTGKTLLEITKLRAEWQSPAFSLETDTRTVLAPDGELVGYVGVRDSAPHVRIYAQGRVHPDYTGRSIGTYLCHWAEKRARQAIPQAMKGARVVLQQSTLSGNKAAQTLLRQQGYQLVRHFFSMVIEMNGSPPAPTMPEGIIIRPFVRDQEARTLVLAAREAFRDHWGYVEAPFEEAYKEWVHWMDDDPSFDPSLWFVAMDGEEIAGFSLCYDIVAEGPDVGEVVMLGVRRPWRRQGLALALLHHSFGELYRRGKYKVTLGVDAQSLTGATRLYEKAGMRVQRQSYRYEKELRPGKDVCTQLLGD